MDDDEDNILIQVINDCKKTSEEFFTLCKLYQSDPSITQSDLKVREFELRSIIIILIIIINY